MYQNFLDENLYQKNFFQNTTIISHCMQDIGLYLGIFGVFTINRLTFKETKPSSIKEKKSIKASF
jgi:hypothetical protein